MEAAVDQLKTDLVRTEQLLRADIHHVDEKVDILNNRLSTHAEATRQQLSALESNLASLSAKQEANFTTVLELITKVQDSLMGVIAKVQGNVTFVEQGLRQEMREMEARLIVAIQAK